MKLKKLAIFLAVTMLLCCAAYAADTLYSNISIGGIEDENGGAFTIETTEAAPAGFAHWVTGKVTQYTPAQAQAANVPAGYSGNVWKVEALQAGDSSSGALIDFSDSRIPVANLRSITFRVYVNSREHNTASSIYIPKMGAWAVTTVVEDKCDTWFDFTIGENYGWRNKGFNNFDTDGDGYLDTINFGAVYSNGCYIDGIKVEYSPNAIGECDSAAMPNGLPGTVTQFVAENAPSGVPAGYEGQVWQINDLNDVNAPYAFGVTFDFSAFDINAADIKSINIRIFASDSRGIKYLYVPRVNGQGGWYMAADNANFAAAHASMNSAISAGNWADLVITQDMSRDYHKENAFVHLGDAEGKLNQFNLRFGTYGETTVYIDSITITLNGGKTINGEMLGAQIRTDGDAKALRFGTNIVANGDITAGDIEKADAADALYAGTLVVGKEHMEAAGITAGQLTHANMAAIQAADVPAANINEDYIEDGTVLYTAVVTGIPSDETEVVARSYIRYTANNGITYKYFYFNPIIRSIANVAASGWTAND